MGRVLASPVALADLAQIRATLIENGEAVSEKFEALFSTAFETLARFPKSGRARPELGPRIRSWVVRPYIVFYRTDEHVHILRVMHSARDVSSSDIRGL